jgi:hypothetical protein
MTESPTPAPGSDAARDVGCECHPGDNGVTHPTAGQRILKRHGQAKKPPCGWIINPLCPVHTSEAS